jgi:hypothetical protein
VIRPGVLFLAAALLAGCAQRIDGGSSSSGDYLRLQGFTLVDPDAGTLDGFLRWLVLDADPEQVDEPDVQCEIWERLALNSVAPDAGCVDCGYQFEGQAAIVDEDTTCVADWGDRSFSLGFGDIADADEEVAALADDGFTHFVSSRWSPDLGTSEGFQTLFTGQPEAWAPDLGDAGTGSGEALAGEHELWCLFYWDVEDTDLLP